MANEVKYFKGKVGHLLSDGSVKVSFPISVIAVDDERKIKLLQKSKKVTEITQEEAAKAYPDLFSVEKEGKKTEQNSDKTAADATKTAGEPTRAMLEDDARKLGVSEDDLKKAKNKADVVALIEDAQEAADKEKEAA